MKPTIITHKVTGTILESDPTTLDEINEYGVRDISDKRFEAKEKILDAMEDQKHAEDDIKQAQDDIKQARNDIKQAKNDIRRAEDDIKKAKDDITQAGGDITYGDVYEAVGKKLGASDPKTPDAIKDKPVKIFPECVMSHLRTFVHNHDDESVNPFEPVVPVTRASMVV